jgi:hypothetical protein
LTAASPRIEVDLGARGGEQADAEGNRGCGVGFASGFYREAVSFNWA